MKRGVLYRVREDRTVSCGICAFKCEISLGDIGKCGVRKNLGGDLIVDCYGVITKSSIKKGLSIGISNIEGPWYLVGTCGCNFRCPSCRFSEFAYRDIIGYIGANFTEPAMLVDQVVFGGLNHIAFGFNEPFVQLEYVLDVFSVAKSKGIKTALLTNGFYTKEALNLILPHTDKFVIYLKAFSSHAMKLYTDVSWRSEVVLNNIIYLRDRGVDFEIATVLVPGVNNSLFEIRSMVRWIIYNLGKDVPWHLFPFKPTENMFMFTSQSKDVMLFALDIAIKEGLNKIYLHS